MYDGVLAKCRVRGADILKRCGTYSGNRILSLREGREDFGLVHLYRIDSDS